MQRINIDPVLSKLSPIQVEAGSIQINKGFSFLGFFKWKANARHPHSPCDPCGLTASRPPSGTRTFAKRRGWSRPGQRTSSCLWTGWIRGHPTLSHSLLQAAPAQLVEQSHAQGTQSPHSRVTALCLMDCAPKLTGPPFGTPASCFPPTVRTTSTRAFCHLPRQLFVFRGPRGVRVASGSRATDRG